MVNLFFKKFKNTEKGFTYVELIVVLSIMSLFTGIAMFNYRIFQSQTEIRNLANNIALKIVEAQKFSLNGKLPSQVPTGLENPWRPSYGLYFDVPSTAIPFNTFHFFVDRDQGADFDLPFNPCNNECMETITIGNGNKITNIYAVEIGGVENEISSGVSVTFTRPSSEAIFDSISIPNPANISHLKIIITSPQGNDAEVLIYASGRVDLN